MSSTCFNLCIAIIIYNLVIEARDVQEDNIEKRNLEKRTKSIGHSADKIKTCL